MEGKMAKLASHFMSLDCFNLNDVAYAIVETNAHFANDRVVPVMSGKIPPIVNQLVSKVSAEQELVLDAVEKRDLNLAYHAFAADPLTTCSLADSKVLFDEMIENTKHYLKMYNI